tara:strand:- start:5105 stop:5518 length:414 start_codon:yes stop_codon:yes gene_type:complete
MSPFNRLKDKLSLGKILNTSEDSTLTEDYVQIDNSSQVDKNSKLLVRTFRIENFDSSKEILDSIRSGSTIAIVNMLPLKDKDSIGLKRVIDKIKKTVDATDGDIAAFGEHWLVVTPGIAKVYRAPKTQPVEERQQYF